MPTLAGIDLGKDIYKENEYSIPRVHSTMTRARDRTAHIWQQSEGPQSFDLVGFSNRGVLKKSQMDALEIEASKINAGITLLYAGISETVRFRHEEPPVIEGTPLGGREFMNDNDIYRNVRIKLMEV